MPEIKLYIAGKVDPNSSFGTSDWRGKVCQALEEKTGLKIVNLDPTAESGLEIDQNNPQLIVGRNSFMQKLADLTLVYLSDDISVGGSQEMLIAKHLGKPLIALAPKGGKFNKEERELFGKKWRNYKDPYVMTSCDKMAENLDEAAEYIKELYASGFAPAKSMQAIDAAIDYYEKNFHEQDTAINNT